MRKILSILGSIGLMATTGVTVIACDGGGNKIQNLIDLNTINIEPINNIVKDPTKLTNDEAIAAQTNVTNIIGKAIKEQINETAELGIDCIMDLSEIKEGANLAGGLKLIVKAKDNSLIIKKNTQKEVQIIFLKEGFDLNKINIDEIKNIVVDPTKLTRDEANTAQANVAKIVKKAIKEQINETAELGIDCIMDLSEIKEGANLAGGLKLIVKAKDDSLIIKKNTQKEVSVRTVEQFSLADLQIDEPIRNNVKNPAKLTDDEAIEARTKVSKNVQMAIYKQFEGAGLDTDFTENLENINWTDNLTNGTTVTFTAKDDSKLLKKGTKREIKVEFY